MNQDLINRQFTKEFAALIYWLSVSNHFSFDYMRLSKDCHKDGRIVRVRLNNCSRVISHLEEENIKAYIPAAYVNYK